MFITPMTMPMAADGDHDLRRRKAALPQRLDKPQRLATELGVEDEAQHHRRQHRPEPRQRR